MAEADNKANSQQQPNREPRLDEKQYGLLKQCSEEKDIAKWNEYRETHTDEEIWLQGAKLQLANLQGANLGRANLQGGKLWEAHLEGADLGEARLEGAELMLAHLEDANLRGANLQGAQLWEANMQGALLWEAHLEGAKLQLANLEGANLRRASLQGALLWEANLKGASLWEANLEGANLWEANVQGADLSRTIVNGETLIDERCKVDRNTKFEGLALGDMRTCPGTRQPLEHNVRRMQWELWYEEGWLLTRITKRLFVHPFWWISNYGLSTWRVILTFLALAIVFATVYFVCGAVDYYHLGIKDKPGIVRDLFVTIPTDHPVSEVHYGVMTYCRSIYFSVVRMATLGFGDMYAYPARPGWRWFIGYFLLILQVVLGYVLFGALVTRFAVLFTAGGPAGEFAESKPEEQIESEKAEGE
jgi:hypothetical protein